MVADAADTSAGPDGRALALAIVAVAAGVGIAWVDSRPTWDDTGITAGLLLLAGLVAAAVGRRRSWLWALLVGGPLPVIEIVTGGSPASVLALSFSAVGATLGWLLRRAIRQGD